ncbi:MAG: FAD:protein FMN transferase, partial [Candidatus Omnitrophota bacterium]
QPEPAVRSAINKVFSASSVPQSSDVSAGQAVDKIVASLKSSGINNAFVFSNDAMFCLGKMADKEMWKGWIPHPTDKKKVFAMLRLEDKAIVTVRSGVVSASVVGDDAAGAEKTAADLLAKGPAGIKAADEAGIDAIVVVKEGNKLNAAMAGGFKEQYGKAKKK